MRTWLGRIASSAFGLLAMTIPFAAFAETAGMKGVSEVKQCIMQNDATLCHSFMTPNSYAIFDTFSSYKLMPCVPTDFTYKTEQSSGGRTIVTAEMPKDTQSNYRFHLVFVKSADNKVQIDIPQTLQAGLGNNWQNQLDLSEQLFLMMRQNLHDQLTCDVLRDLLTRKDRQL